MRTVGRGKGLGDGFGKARLVIFIHQKAGPAFVDSLGDAGVVRGYCDTAAGHRFLDGGGQAFGVAVFCRDRVLQKELGRGQHLADLFMRARTVECHPITDPQLGGQRLGVVKQRAVPDEIQRCFGNVARGFGKALQGRQRCFLFNEPPDGQTGIRALFGGLKAAYIHAGRNDMGILMPHTMAGEIIQQELRYRKDASQTRHHQPVGALDAFGLQRLRGVCSAIIRENRDRQFVGQGRQSKRLSAEFSQNNLNAFAFQKLGQGPLARSEGKA